MVWSDGVFAKVTKRHPDSNVTENSPFIVVHEGGEGVLDTGKTAPSKGGTDDKLILRLEADPPTVIEGESTTLTMYLSKALTKSGGTRISLRGSSSSADVSDYSMSSCRGFADPDSCDAVHSFNFPAGTTKSSVRIDIIKDDIDEGEEYLVFSRGSRYGRGAASREFYSADCELPDCRVKITVKDVRTVDLAVPTNPVQEGDPVTVKVELSDAPKSEVEIPLRLKHKCGNCTAESDDYGQLPSIIIPAGETERTGTITTEIDSDPDDEIFKVALVNLPPGIEKGVQNSVLVKIKEVFIEINFASASATLGEDVGTHRVVVNLGNATPAGGLTVNYSVSGTAEGTDYRIDNSGKLSIAAGEASAMIPVQVTDDNETEGAETIILKLENGTEYFAGSEATYTLTITDNDPSVVVLSASPNPVDEGDSVTIMAELSKALSSEVKIPLILEADTAEPVDYGGLTKAEIPISGGSTTGTVEIPITDDKEEESMEKFSVVMDERSLPSTLTGGDPKSVDVEIIDNDELTITWSADPNPVYEGQVTNLKMTVSKPFTFISCFREHHNYPCPDFFGVKVETHLGNGDNKDFTFMNPERDAYLTDPLSALMNFYPDPSNPGYTLTTASIPFYIVSG